MLNSVGFANDTVGIGGIRSPMTVVVNFECTADERKEFVQCWGKGILERAQLVGLDTSDPDFVLLNCSLGACGGQATYRTVNDIPLVDVPCPCGDPNHWLIKWTESRDHQ